MAAERLLDALRRVKAVRFDARGSAWVGAGIGSVAVASPADGVITFAESGTWRPERGGEFEFSNVFRWSAVAPELVRLEHLRFGPDRPVHLFDLAPDGDGWRSVEPHTCVADSYAAEVRPLASGLWVAWQIIGPKKREAIEYAYDW